MQSKKNLMNKKTQNEWADWLQLTYVPTSSSKEVVAACIVWMTDSADFGGERFCPVSLSLAIQGHLTEFLP